MRTPPSGSTGTPWRTSRPPAPTRHHAGPGVDRLRIRRGFQAALCGRGSAVAAHRLRTQQARRGTGGPRATRRGRVRRADRLAVRGTRTELRTHHDRAGRRRPTVNVVDDQHGQPSWTVDVAAQIVALVRSERGCWRLPRDEFRRDDLVRAGQGGLQPARRRPGPGEGDDEQCLSAPGRPAAVQRARPRGLGQGRLGSDRRLAGCALHRAFPELLSAAGP